MPSLPAPFLFQYQGKVDPLLVAATPPTVANTRWFMPLSEPTRRKFNTALYVDSDANSTAFFTPLAKFDWYKNFGGFGGSFTVGSAQSDFPVVPNTAPATVSMGWFAPFADPVRGKRVQQQPINWLPFTQLIDFDWYRNLDEPVRLKRAAQQQQALAWTVTTPTLVDFDWYKNFTGLGGSYSVASTQADFPVVPTAAPPVTVAIDWFVQFSDVLRVKPRQQSFSAYVPTPLISLEWHKPFAEVLRCARLMPQPVNWTPFTPPTVAPSFDWYKNFSGMSGTWGVASNQAGMPVAPSPTPAVVMGWLSALSEPTRRPYRDTRDALIYHPRLLPTPAVTVTVAAGETGQDLMNFLLAVTSPITVRTIKKAYASIVEIPKIKG